MKKITIILTAAAMITATFFSLPAVSGAQKDDQAKAAQKGPAIKKSEMPFLIRGKMPHLTALLMKQWDSPELNLTESQKKSLIIIRENTLPAVKRLAKQIKELEAQVVEGVNQGKPIKELEPIVIKISNLRTLATMFHIKCIYETRKVLSPTQLEILLESASH